MKNTLLSEIEDYLERCLESKKTITEKEFDKKINTLVYRYSTDLADCNVIEI